MQVITIENAAYQELIGKVSSLIIRVEQLAENKAPVKKYFTIAEAADMLNVSRLTVYRQAKKGSIPAKRIGSRVMIPADFFTK